ncbi:hypothetical protein [Paenibacillus koleovorans]|uniref:hypothetical protein n=1 Tax=Paenibacillus koleovorans TaxID=121608 RepID=UPI000FD82325|nr:hypothetical protein [Paenibacillus koleovorans]
MKTTNTPTRDLEADLAICEAATPGNWETDGFSVFTEMKPDYSGGYSIFHSHEGPNRENDCEFASAARAGWPYAIRRAMEAENEIDRLRNELNMLQEQLQQQHRSACYD